MASATATQLLPATVTGSPGLANSTLVAPLVALGGEVDPETCQLLGPVALGVQALMGIIVVGSLVLKRAQERPKRKWRVWLGDVSKQVVGQAFVHASNVLISDLIAQHKMDNPCSLYALNIFVDTTIGVVILWAFLKAATVLVLQYVPDFRSGDYGQPFSMRAWTQQACVYVACLGAMKVAVLVIFWLFPVLFAVANWCLSWIDSDDAQVVLVMLILPLVMNVFQFLVVDSLIKSKTPTSSAFLDPRAIEDEESRRGFLDRDSDDHEGDYEDSHDRPIQKPSDISQSQEHISSTKTNDESSRINGQIAHSRSQAAAADSDEWPELSDSSFDSPRSSAERYPPTYSHSQREPFHQTRAEPVPTVLPEHGEKRDDEKDTMSDSGGSDAWGVNWSDDEAGQTNQDVLSARRTSQDAEKVWGQSPSPVAPPSTWSRL
ncbi:hypothetical protein OIV83_001573 [Microbotryomycetes sp. JL201]|nr:hypothetical protein OIV83_001573 [Microbotryomycetes sp. JL201]